MDYLKIPLNQNNNSSLLRKTGNVLALTNCSMFLNFQETLEVLLSDYSLKALNKLVNTKKTTNSLMKITIVSVILIFLTAETIRMIILMELS